MEQEEKEEEEKEEEEKEEKVGTRIRLGLKPNGELNIITHPDKNFISPVEIMG